MATTKSIPLAISSLILATLACNSILPQTEPTTVPTQTLVATQIIEPVFTQSQVNLPQTEDEVPRVAVEEAKAALDSGTAIIVDVRSPAAYEANHIAGAISVSLGAIETYPMGLELDKDQWIITYCT